MQTPGTSLRRPVLRFGLQIARFDYPGIAPDKLFERVACVARTAQAAGFDSIWVQDHFHQAAVPGIGLRPDEPVLEPYTLLSALAAVTSTVRLGAMVTGVTFRNPALLAKTVTSLDVISGGRAVLGLGAAWLESEHAGYGFEFPPTGERMDRLEETLRICRAMFTQTQTTYTGAHYRLDGAINVPQPVSPGGPPILIGGSGERRTLPLVARYADACNLFGGLDIVRRKLAILDEHCAAQGRDPAQITRSKMACLLVSESQAEAQRRYDAMVAEAGQYAFMLRSAIVGDPERVAEQVKEYLDAGLDGLVFYLPDTYDLDAVGLAGETLTRYFGV